MTIKSSEHYLQEACAAAELARQQSHSPQAMQAHAARGALLLELSVVLAEREAAGLEPAEPQLPVAVLDCHDRRWDRRPDGWYDMRGARNSAHTGVALAQLEAEFGPLRPAEVSR